MAALVAVSAASAVGFLLLAAIPAFFFLLFFYGGGGGGGGGGGWKRRQVLLPPVVGTIFHQFLNFQRLHDYHTELSRLHKNYRLLSPFGQQLYTTDPAVVEYILKTNFNNYGKGLYNYRNLRDLFGDGIFAVDGDKWSHQRKLASFNFSTKSLRDFSGAIFKNTSSKLARILSAYANSNEQFDMQDLLMKSTMDSTFKIAFGFELDCSGGSNQDGDEFAKAFDAANEFTMLRYVNVFWRIMRLLGVGSEAALKQNLKVIDEFVYKVMDIRFKQIANADQEKEKGDDILSKFLEEIKNQKTTMDTRYLRDIILSFVIAGKDTTAGSLAWFFYLICKDPSVQEKIHQEVKRVVLLETKECTDFVEFSRNINDETLNNLHYLHASLTETLRLFPVVPLVSLSATISRNGMIFDENSFVRLQENKVCFSDDILPGGYNVSKGDIVFFQPYAMGRMEYLWGEDAESFRPERWLDDEGIFQPESPFKFVAFQAGPRICLGREFAYRQMKTFAAVLLYFFQFKFSDEEKVVHYKTMTTLQIDQGLYLQVSSR